MQDNETRVHQEWLGLIQPVGLVVAPTALISAQVVPDRSFLAKWLEYHALLISSDDELVMPDWPTFARQFLEWSPSLLSGSKDGSPLPPELTVVLPDLDVTLQPTYAVADPHTENTWLLLIAVEEAGVKLDRVPDGHGAGWNATPHDRFERLLRETNVPAGLLVSDDIIRFVYAPRGESSGWLNFPVASMATPSGRPMLSAMYELLKGWRLSKACPEPRGLRRILVESRKYQNVVSTKLAEQVLGALYELARGMQSADDAADGTVLHDTLRQAPSQVYGGLLTTIMRLVFVLYAEERDMLPSDPAWEDHYSIRALLDQLRTDKAQHPDTMDQRYGTWSRLLSLFRILHDGASHDAIVIPSRAGELFDPDRYPFLEGRPYLTRRVMGVRLTNVPRVSDGTLLRVLERLLVLDAERLSYRALDVEQIGSVYEAMMGFEAMAARGISIAVKPKTKKAGSPSHAVVNLEALAKVKPADRAKWLKENADCELPTADSAALRAANDVDGLLKALDKRISPFTPQPIALGGLVLSPTEERRRSGSHYTPRELTEPIVATTLRPVLEALGSAPTPNQLLDLRVCDPAMGSGAFLVGVCRFLGDKLVEAWQRTNSMPSIPLDEDPQLFARRLIAQRCLYGVDRNPFAVQLAKLSLWLVTLAREHPFTFLDHSLRGGDSLVGLNADQIEAFHWNLKKRKSAWGPALAMLVGEAKLRREQIANLADTDDTEQKLRLLEASDESMRFVRLAGDAIVAAFFASGKDKKREATRVEHEKFAQQSIGKELRGGRLENIAETMRAQEFPLVPFHWQVEFPEVFARDNPGFDAIVGNPPFAGKNTLLHSNPEHYLDWLQSIHEESHGNADLVAHFFRRTHTLLRKGGCFGLIATNTIAQGDTRSTGLRWLRQHDTTIYKARRRYRWPGAAAVVVSVVHGIRGAYSGLCVLDDNDVDRITAFLFHAGGDVDPRTLVENAERSFIGSYVLGMGFTFDDSNEGATPISEMHRLLAEDPSNLEAIFPYLGGDEVNDSPTHAHHRYVIRFGDLSEAVARSRWPSLMALVEQKVKPQRDLLGNNPDGRRRKQNWWQWGRSTPALDAAVACCDSVLAIARVSNHFAVAQLKSTLVFSEQLVVIVPASDALFGNVQARVHELWFGFFGSTHEDRPRYTPSDCFESFPFVDGASNTAAVEASGQKYREFRASLMVTNGEGLRDTYNRFHDPDEVDLGILRLRELHDEMDRAVLDAYGWNDLQPVCEFILDYEDDDDSASRRKKPWRYRWPNDIRDEVLARLLALNRQRAKPAVAAQSSLF